MLIGNNARIDRRREDEKTRREKKIVVVTAGTTTARTRREKKKRNATREKGKTVEEIIIIIINRHDRSKDNISGDDGYEDEKTKRGSVVRLRNHRSLTTSMRMIRKEFTRLGFFFFFFLDLLFDRRQ